MELGVRKRRKLKILLVILAATIAIVAALVMMYINGLFLPGWIEWKSTSADYSFLKKGVKVQDTLNADIDHDGEDELLILCWRIGRYGDRRPFWVTHDEIKWSQHIYIYEETGTDSETGGKSYKAKWMASDIHTNVAKWESFDENLVVTYTPSGEKNVWIWNSWGLERISEEDLNKYLTRKSEMEKAQSLEENDQVVNENNQPNSENNQFGSENAQDDPAGNKTISVVMVGDILLHDGVTASCKSDDGTYDFSPLFENTKDVISSADIAIVNQEVIIGGEELRVSGYPAFNAPYEIGDALYDAGFDVVCHGTNHALDRSKKGILNCLDYWNTTHPDVAVLGIHDSEEGSEEIYIRDVDGFRIAILNYTYGTNGIPLPEGMPYCVDLLNKEKIEEDLAYAEENADFTIVCPHWGIEYQLEENAEQEKMAEFMTENGADLIIGTHPHVIEPVKWVEAGNGNKSLCFYSLGNYINWTSGRGAGVAGRMVGAMAYISINIEDNGENDRIDEYGAVPLISHVEHARGEVTTYFLEDYSEDCASKNAIIEQDSAFDLDYCNNLCSKVLGDNTQYIVEMP